MQNKTKVIEFIVRNELPKYMKASENAVQYWRSGKSEWYIGVDDLWNLGRLKLIENNIETARTLFHEGVELMINNNKSDSGQTIIQIGQWDGPIYAYLGDGREKAIMFGEGILKNLEKTKPSLKGTEILHSWRSLLLSYIIGNSERMRLYSEDIEKECSKIRFGSNGLPASLPGHLEWGYALFGKKMIQGLVDRDEALFVTYLGLWSNLLLNRISRSTMPKYLAAIELIYLYDMSIGLGMKSTSNTPFIPKSIINNGYWNKPP